MHGLAALIATKSLVVKEYYVDPKGTHGGLFVRIVGRPGGLVDFLFSLLGIDTTTKLEIYANRIVYTSSSLSGSMTTMYPMTSIAGATSGFFKPIIYLALAVLTLPTFILPVIFIVLYFVQKSLLVSIEATSGSFSAIAFKRSVIEGKKLEREDADEVIRIVNHLIMNAGPRHQLAAA